MSDESVPSHIYSLSEARLALEVVAPVIERLVQDKRKFDAVQAALLRLTPDMKNNGHRAEAVALEHQLEKVIDRLASGIRTIEEMSVVIKDIEHGIIDFPARHQDRIVYLCWKLGETSIEFWHEIHTGFAGRRPVSELE